MNIAKIIPGTFKSEESTENRAWLEEVVGTVQVEFEGKVFETKAVFICGLCKIKALGFVGNTKTGKYKNRPVHVNYFIKDDEHSCQMGGRIAIHTMRFDPEAVFQ